MRPTVLLLLGLLAVTAGCRSARPISSDYASSTDLITFESSEVALQTGRRSGSLVVRAFAGCSDLPCQPDRVTLVFISRSTEQLYRDNRQLRVDAGGIRLEWPGPAYDLPAYRQGPRREEISVELSPADFRDIATAETVEGRLGGTEWTISYEERADFRSMIRQFE